MYYSNIIMARALPHAVQYISLGIAAVNALATLPAILLIGRMGWRNLLILSSPDIPVSLLVVGYGIDAGRQTMSSVGIITLVAYAASPCPFLWVPRQTAAPGGWDVPWRPRASTADPCKQCVQCPTKARGMSL